MKEWLVWSICKQDLQERFAGSLLGAVWVFIWPLVQLFIYLVIFGKLMGARLGISGSAFSYGIYIGAGLLCWTYFSHIISRCSRFLLDKRNIIRKVRVNLAIFPAAICLGEAMPFCAGFLLLACFDLLTGWLPSPALFCLFLLACYCLIALGLGLGLVFACLAIFVRDVVEIVSICLQMAFWFTPIVYLISILPNWLSDIIWINPMVAITGVFQQFFILGGQPDWPILIYSFVISNLALVFGFWILNKWRKEILDAC